MNLFTAQSQIRIQTILGKSETHWTLSLGLAWWSPWSPTVRLFRLILCLYSEQICLNWGVVILICQFPTLHIYVIMFLDSVVYVWQRIKVRRVIIREINFSWFWWSEEKLLNRQSLPISYARVFTFISFIFFLILFCWASAAVHLHYILAFMKNIKRCTKRNRETDLFLMSKQTK